MLSKIIRQTHMYLALFFMPWMLIYALSTMGMNHRQFVASFYKEKQPQFTEERKVVYEKTFPDDMTLEAIGKQILQDVNLDGTHNIRGEKGKTLTITRLDPITLRRITYHPDEGTVLVERQEYQTRSFLGRLHRRRGYSHPYLLEDTWGLTVELVLLAMIFWVFSGIWMWWEMKSLRKWGVISLVSGFGLFAVFLIFI